MREASSDLPATSYQLPAPAIRRAEERIEETDPDMVRRRQAGIRERPETSDQGFGRRGGGPASLLFAFAGSGGQSSIAILRTYQPTNQSCPRCGSRGEVRLHGFVLIGWPGLADSQLALTKPGAE